MKRTHPRARGFTIIEMLVSVAVLVIALSIVAVVFKVTTQTASEAAAYAEVNTYVRQFLAEIQSDLDGIDPSASVLVLYGRKQPAALTKADLAGGKYFRVLTGEPNAAATFDPETAPPNALPAATGTPDFPYSEPRSDILMFITNRRGPSQAPPPVPANGGFSADVGFATAAANGAQFSPQVVVYGHASFADPVWNANTGRYEAPAYQPTNAFAHITDTLSDGSGRSRIPAAQWCLARKAWFAYPSDPNTPAQFRPVLTLPFPDRNNDRLKSRLGLAAPDLDHGYAGDMAMFDVADFLAGLQPIGPRAGVALASPYVLRDLWWDYVGAQFNRTSLVNVLDAMMFAQNPNNGSTLLNAGGTHHVATVLNDVPVDLRSNLAVQMLPGCVWFQVEYLLPEDPRNSVYASDPNEYVGASSSGPGTLAQVGARSDNGRWVSLNAATANFTPNYAACVFAPDSPENRALLVQSRFNTAGAIDPSSRFWSYLRRDANPARNLNIAPTTDPSEVSQRVVRLWPYALRITVQAYDPRGRLKQPIVRTLVHRFE